MSFLLIVLALSPLSYATVCTSSSLDGLAVGQQFPFTQSSTKTYGTYNINSLSGHFTVVDGCTLGVSITLGTGDSITSPMGIQVYGKTTTGTSGFPVGSTVISGSGTININIPFDTTNYVVSTTSKGVAWVDIASLSLFSSSTVAGSGWQVSDVVTVVGSGSASGSGTSNNVQTTPSAAAPVIGNPVAGVSTPTPHSDALSACLSMISLVSLLFLVAF